MAARCSPPEGLLALKEAIAGIEADAAKLPVVAAAAHKAGGAIRTSLDEAALVTVEKVMDLRQADKARRRCDRAGRGNAWRANG